MDMTEDYEKRLVKLAKEVLESIDDLNYSDANNLIGFVSQVNFLLGYIMALDKQSNQEEEND